MFGFLKKKGKINSLSAIEKQSEIKERLLKFSRLSPEEALIELGSSIHGLSEEEVEIRQKNFESNDIAKHNKKNAFLHLWECFANPFNILLSILALISYLTEDETAAIIILIMVVIATLLRFFQESRSNKEADAISSLVSNTIAVLRTNSSEEKKEIEIKGSLGEELPIAQLVPGDVIYLSAGDMVPSDVKILSSKDLFVSQAALTGESIPLEKFSSCETDPRHSNLFDIANLAFMGTNIVSGSATALVISTGSYTFFGTMAKQLTNAKPMLSDFQKGIKKVSWLLIQFMFVMVPIVLLINGFTKGDWIEASLFALSVAVGLTPEMLPMIVTATLAKGSLFLSRKKVIVKNLESIQSFGAMDVLCTDKTGTLTQDKIILDRYLDFQEENNPQVLIHAYLNSHYQTGLRNLLDIAVLSHAGELADKLELDKNYKKVDEIPFDFVRRRMSVIVSEKKDHNLLICKGAVEEILSISSSVMKDGQAIPLGPEEIKTIQEMLEELSKQGLRVVAVATKEEPIDKKVYSISDENSLVLSGFVAFLDPPKESTAPALEALANNGISTKILTGDNEYVTRNVCSQVGLEITGVILGPQIDGLSDEELQDKVNEANIFAKLTPMHKERIVKALQAKGHVVGYMGDGINDAPALKAADVGISVDSAVDIAKESADLILLEKSLMVLEDGVMEGRRTFSNMMKYIKMAASSNFGNVFSVMIASAFIPFLPMLPIHLLTQNLLYDISQTAIPFDNVDKEDLMKPQTWNPKDIARFMIFFGPLSSIFDVITFAVMWFVFKANSPEHQTLFQSGWFIEGLVSQTLIVHMIRTRKIPFIGSIAAWPLLFMTLLVVVIGIAIPQSFLAPYFSLEPLPSSYFVWLTVIILGYMGLTQMMKGIYSRLYGWNN